MSTKTKSAIHEKAIAKNPYDLQRQAKSVVHQKHKNQYDDNHQPFLCKIWTQRWNTLWNEQELAEQ